MSNKLKILLFGAINDQVDGFVNKLKALNSSKAGPFDAAFSVGPCDANKLKERAKELSIRVYLQDPNIEVEPIDQTEEESVAGVSKLAKNLYLLQDPSGAAAGIWSLPVADKKPELVVAACPTRLRVDSKTAKSLLEKLHHVSYTGADLLLTTEWPQGIERILHDYSTTTDTPVSFDIADIALKARARYHVAPGLQFIQSPPFGHLAATTNTTISQHVGRFISLAPVVTASEAKQKGKTGKFVHALGLTPLHSMNAVELQEQKPVDLKPCPFTDESYQADRQASASANKTLRSNTGLSEASARRILAEERQKRSGANAPAQRWAGGKRDRPNDEEQQEVDPTNTRLFVYGLHKDVTGQLQSPQGNLMLLQAFTKYGATKISKPPNAATSSFCFCEFSSHEQAAHCLEDLGGEINVNGVNLSLKWATSSNKGGGEPSQKRTRFLTEAEARDSSRIHYKLPKTITDKETAGETLKKCMETTLEDALAGDDGEKVSAADEPALQVKVFIPDKEMSYGFLEFASHAAASMVLATLTGSTDGGMLLTDAPNLPKEMQGLYLNWASAREKEKEIIEDASGFKFERKHFPADSRKDCWFCLASEACEKHLITGVYNTCYAAMPKGPVHEGHILLIPVQHSSQGALKDQIVAEEMDELKAKLRRHASEVYDKDLFVFERAIQTKGGYHTHVQCVPVPRKLGLKLQATMLTQARKSGFDLRELKSDLGLSSVLAGDDDGDEGYFYAEIPGVGSEPKRFLYKADGRALCPLQFGREVVAAVEENPELAHWKACVVDKEQEAKLAASFRESFAKYTESS